MTPIQPVVRFHGPGGTEGEPEYVELGAATEAYWLGTKIDDIRRARDEAVATGRFPRPHGQRLTHPASHFWVDPAHFLFVYGELRGGDDDELALGRIVGWDPPMSLSPAALGEHAGVTWRR